MKIHNNTIKILLKILAVIGIVYFMLVASYLWAQDDARYTLGINTEWADKNTHNEAFNYGVNLGAHVEYQHENQWLYLRARTFYFPELNDVPYFDIDGGVGLNWRFLNDTQRIYGGAFAGVINREGWGHGKVGLEIGYDFYFSDRFYVGVKHDTQYKHDDKIWHTNDESGHNVTSWGLILGYYW